MPRKPKPEKPSAEILAPIHADILDQLVREGPLTAAAVETVKRGGATSIRLIALIAAPEGVARVHRDHPDVHIVVASVDRGLNEKGYILPGLGDAGDRLYGTK